MRFLVVRPVFRWLGVVYFGLFPLALPVIMLYNGFYLEGITFLVLWAFSFFFGVINNYFIKSIVINKEGVKHITLFKTLELKWNEIQIIGIGYIPIKKPGKKPWIYFSADKVVLPVLAQNMTNDKIFLIQYREKIVEVIKQYWPHDIVGLDKL